MRFVLVDRRIFWPGFGLSFVGSTFGAGWFLTPLGTLPSTADVVYGWLLVLAGPALVATGAYPAWRSRVEDRTVTSSNWPWKRLWPYSQLIPANLWVLIAGFVLLAVGVAAYLAQFEAILAFDRSGGTIFYYYALPTFATPWVFLVSILWGAPTLDTPPSTRVGPTR